MAGKTNEDLNLELYKTLFNNSLDSILLTKINGTIFYANPAAQDIFGYNQDEFCKLRREDLVDSSDKNLSILLSQRTDHGKAKGELTLIKKDGTKFPAEVSTSIFSYDGNHDRTFMIIRDISKRKLNEKQIEYHSTLLDLVNYAVVGVDENFIINYWNKGAETTYGYTESEAIGKIVHELLQHENFLDKGTEPNIKTNFTTDTFNKKMEKIVSEVNLTEIHDKSGNKGYLIVYHDITANKQEEEIKKKLRKHEHILTDQLQTTNLDLKIMTEKLKTTNKELMLQQDYLLNLNQELEEREELSQALNRVNAHINSKYCYDEIMESILEEGVKSLGAESALINLLENDKWIVKYSYNFPDNIKGQVKTHEESPTSVYVVNEKRAVAFNDAVNDPRVNRKGMKVYGVSSLLVAPIILNNEVVGVIAFYHHKNQVVFSEAQVDFADKLASSLSHAIESSKLFETIKNSEKKYHSLYSAMNEGVALHDIIYDSKGEAVDYVITDTNKSYKTILGLDDEEVIGRRASDVYGTDEPPYLEIYARVARTGIYEKFKTYYEPLNKHFSISVVSPEKNRFATVFEDISSRIEYERKLYKSEEKYRNIIDNLQDGFIRIDTARKIVMVSPSAAMMHGFSSSKTMQGKEVQPLFADGAQLDGIIQILNRNGEVKNFECTLLKLDGRSFHASLNCQYHLDEAGQKKGIDIFIRDITDQKQTESDLEKSRNNLSEAQRIAHIGSWEWQVDTDELTWSDELYSIFNLDRKSYKPTMKSFFNYLHPDDREFVSKQINNIGLGNEKVKFDFRIILNNGSIRILTARAELTHHDPDGNTKKIMGIYQDVTEIKSAEQEILTGKNVIEAINNVFQESLTAESEKEVVMKCLEVAEDLTGSEFGFLGEINKKGRLDDRTLSPPAWSKCETENAIELLKDMEIVSYWGRTIKESKSQIVNDPNSDPDKRGLPKGHPPINNFMGVPLKKGAKTIGMIALANKNGNYTNQDKKNIETLSVAFVEVLMRKKAELEIISNMKRLAQSNKELEQFAYITSHDLREPLRMITSFLQLLQRRYEDQLDKDANEFIEFAVDGAKRLDNMTNDLLSYSRITSEKRKVKLVNFEEVLKEALQNLKIPIEETKAVITHEPLPTIKGNAKLKVQLFQNIIGNALKYRSEKTPEIHISAKKKNDHYIFSIKDNGIGMSKDHLKKIFTIFQRLHTQDEYEGT
ncbi:MAG: PAS domain S-box protein, partial [Methanobacterium sp.]|nr:PAS domain S-box protein [Methanobacterium sp.]